MALQGRKKVEKKFAMRIKTGVACGDLIRLSGEKK